MDKVTGQCPQTTTFLKRKESRSGIEPRSFRLPTLTPYRLGQTGSRDGAAGCLDCCKTFYLFLKYFFVPCGKCGWPYLGKTQKPQEQCYSFLSVSFGLVFVVVVLVCPNSGIGCQVLMRVTAHEGCADTVTESAPEVKLRVPGEIKRSRDLRGGRWSWTLNLAQKRS